MIKATLFPMQNTDVDVVNVARCSFDKFNETFDETKDVKLINYLASHGHWTPMAHNRITIKSMQGVLPRYQDIHPDLRSHLVFARTPRGDVYERHSLHGWVQLIKSGLMNAFHEKSLRKLLTKKFPVTMEAYGLTCTDPHVRHDLCTIANYNHPDFIDVTLQETVPIFVARQDFKHKGMFVENEVSRRYVSDSPTFYEPEVWRGKPEGSIKQGSAGVVEWADDRQDYSMYDYYADTVEQLLITYNQMLKRNVAPEMARMVLPQSMMTQYIRTASLTAWARMVNQRVDPHAQVEIQELATQVNEIIKRQHPAWWATARGINCR